MLEAVGLCRTGQELPAGGLCRGAEKQRGDCPGPGRQRRPDPGRRADRKPRYRGRPIAGARGSFGGLAKDENRALVVVTHDPGRPLAIADRVMAGIRDGSLINLES